MVIARNHVLSFLTDKGAPLTKAYDAILKTIFPQSGYHVSPTSSILLPKLLTRGLRDEVVD